MESSPSSESSEDESFEVLSESDPDCIHQIVITDVISVKSNAMLTHEMESSSSSETHETESREFSEDEDLFISQLNGFPEDNIPPAPPSSPSSFQVLNNN